MSCIVIHDIAHAHAHVHAHVVQHRGEVSTAVVHVYRYLIHVKHMYIMLPHVPACQVFTCMSLHVHVHVYTLICT